MATIRLLYCHGDGSDGRHACTKPYALLSGYYLINCLTMAMVVMGDMCVQSITVIRTAAVLQKVLYSLLFVVNILP